VVVPPHRPTIRIDLMDQVYLSAMEKYKAVINDIVIAMSAASRCW